MKTSRVSLFLMVVSIALVVVSSALLIALSSGSVPVAAVSALAGLGGGVIGAAGAVGGQVVNGRLQAQREARASVVAGTEAARGAVIAESRELLADLVELQRDLQTAKPSIMETLHPDEWRKHWKAIWTDERSLRIDVASLLVMDPSSRRELRRLVRLLDASSFITDPGWPGRSRNHLQQLGLSLSGVALNVVADYLRRDPSSTQYESKLAELERELEEYNRWKAEMIRRAEDPSEAADSDNEVAGGPSAPGAHAAGTSNSVAFDPPQ